MIDPLNREHRGRLSSAMQYWYNAHENYRLARRETIMHHVGSTAWAHTLGVNIDKGMFGNLMQLAAQGHAVQMAYGTPQFKCISQIPEADHIAPSLQALMNRYSHLIGLGDTARQLALDSFFGYAISYTDNMMLPPAAANATGVDVGPNVFRISQDNFFFDGEATSWEKCSWMAHMYNVPLEKARNFPGFDPEAASKLEEFSAGSGENEGQLHHSGSTRQNGMAMTRLVNVWLPHARVIATWSVNNFTFAGIEGAPLMVRPWEGHHTGPYEVMTLLDIPDNLIPVAPSESTKRLHVLFNELGDITSEQARKAKVNPIYERGFERDMERLTDADDRASVPVTDIRKIGTWERPGPSQTQTAYMNASLQLFKEMSGNLDDTLGLAPTAGTNGQSQLIRQATSARAAEKRRRMDRMMENIAKKLAHLLLNDQTIRMPLREKLGTTELWVDYSWERPDLLPRKTNADDFSLTLVPYTLEYRAPALRVELLAKASERILRVMQQAQQGAPVDVEAYVEIEADYNDLPELRRIYSGMLPEFQKRTQAAGMSLASSPQGEYVHRSVSDKSNGGALTQNLQQAMGGQAQPPQGAEQGGVRIG